MQQVNSLARIVHKTVLFYNELLEVEQRLQKLEEEFGHKYSPDQPRVPSGNPNGGQWTNIVGGGGNSLVGGIVEPRPKPSGSIVEFPHNKPNDGFILNIEDGGDYGDQSPTYQGEPDLPLESVYPVEEIVVFWVGGEAIIAARDAIGLSEGIGAAEAGATTVAEAGLTEHGILRSAQRGISGAEADEAISTAQQAGNVTTQIGKYGTPQNIYRGTNGVTAVVETSGRNAGKIITIYRH